MDMKKLWDEWNDAESFSGVFSMRDKKGIVFEECCGFRNRSERLPNNSDTAFGIASGTKMLTGLSICKLIDEGELSLEDKLYDILPYDLGRINQRVSVFHLLTHTSGIGDYIDEEDPNTYEKEQELCNQYPVYLWERLDYYLKMITPLTQKFEPGERFGYSNAGYIMLGLVIEAISGVSFQKFVSDKIIQPLGLKHTGFYRMDSLPANTALGYIDAESERTNIYSLPVIGGSDGGLYTCAQDLDTLWRSLFAGQFLSENMLTAFLKPQVERSLGESYGLGVYRYDLKRNIAYYAVGSDFGVDFFTVYFPQKGLSASALCNTAVNTGPLRRSIIAKALSV